MQKKALDKIQNPFLTKNPNNLRIYDKILNMIKELYRKPINNIRVNCEILTAFPLRLGKRKGCLLSLLLLNIILEVLVNVIIRIVIIKKLKRKTISIC